MQQKKYQEIQNIESKIKNVNNELQEKMAALELKQ